jgi:hypothetical protein
LLERPKEVQDSKRGSSRETVIEMVFNPLEETINPHQVLVSHALGRVTETVTPVIQDGPELGTARVNFNNTGNASSKGRIRSPNWGKRLPFTVRCLYRGLVR